MIIEIGYVGYFLLLLGLAASKIQFPIIFISFICLIITFVGEDYSLDYVSKNSNSSLPLIYKISAAWAGHEGSMLLWCVVSSFWMFLASVYSKDLTQRLRVNFLTIMGLLNFSFLLFVVVIKNLFESFVIFRKIIINC